jgi:hypothetical protein
MTSASGQAHNLAITTFSYQTQVANKLGLVRDETDRARNVGREPNLPGDNVLTSLVLSLKSSLSADIVR